MLSMKFIMLINVLMPKIVGILKDLFKIRLKDFLSGAMAALVFGGVEPFMQTICSYDTPQ